MASLLASVLNPAYVGTPEAIMAPRAPVEEVTINWRLDKSLLFMSDIFKKLMAYFSLKVKVHEGFVTLILSNNI
jgi:hypothetical protein